MVTVALGLAASPRSAASTRRRSSRPPASRPSATCSASSRAATCARAASASSRSSSEGDLLSLVGEVVSSTQKPYQDKRTRRTAYRLEVRVRAEDGSLALTYFDRQQHTADWRARELATGRVGLFSGRLKWFNGQWQLTNPDSRMYGAAAEDAFASMPDLIPIYSSVAGVNTWHLEETIAHRARPRRGRPRRAAAGGARGRGPDRGRPGAALDPPPGQLGPEGQGRRTG